MRLFTGIDLGADARESMRGLIERLRPAARVQWSPPDNLHVTTKFIGEWPEERLDELKQALAALPRREAIEVRLHGVGFYPNERAPRIFWCGIEAPGLAELARETDAAAAALGIARERRAYSPHLTLARIRDGQDSRALCEAARPLTGAGFGSVQAAGFYLYHSRLTPSGSVYTKLAEFPFQQR